MGIPVVKHFFGGDKYKLLKRLPRRFRRAKSQKPPLHQMREGMQHPTP